MAPQSLALFRSTNCWPVVGGYIFVVVPVPSSMLHPVRNAVEARAIRDEMIIFFMCDSSFLVEQFGFFRLVFLLRNDAGIPGLLQIQQLLADGRRNRLLHNRRMWVVV